MNESDYKQFVPLIGFAVNVLCLTRLFFSSVVDTLRLADGTLFPMPIYLDIWKEDVESLSLAPGSRVALRDPRDDQALAIITGSYNIFRIPGTT